MSDHLSRVFAALADPTRRDMVARLADGDATVGQLAEPYRCQLQAVYKHLKVLEDAGLVSRSREAQPRPVHLEAEVFDLMDKWIERYRRQAEERYRRLDAVLAQLNEQDDPQKKEGTDMTSTMNSHSDEATIEADPKLPIIRMTRDFAATPEQLLRAHTDPELFAQWVGPNGTETRIERVGRPRPAAAGGSCPTATARSTRSAAASTSVAAGRIVQTFTYEGEPDGVALETLWFEDLGDGRTRLHAQSLVDSFESRDAWLRSGMEIGVNEGYAKLDEMLADGAV